MVDVSRNEGELTSQSIFLCVERGNTQEHKLPTSNLQIVPKTWNEKLV
jgi:hypothetical protein